MKLYPSIGRTCTFPFRFWLGSYSPQHGTSFKRAQKILKEELLTKLLIPFKRYYEYLSLFPSKANGITHRFSH